MNFIAGLTACALFALTMGIIITPMVIAIMMFVEFVKKHKKEEQ